MQPVHTAHNYYQGYALLEMDPTDQQRNSSMYLGDLHSVSEDMLIAQCY
jgi:hypothetical protein